MSKQPIPAANFLQQSQNAAEMMQRHHQNLLDAGFTWDGMDGYTAPEGADPDLASSLWARLINEETE